MKAVAELLLGIAGHVFAHGARSGASALFQWAGEARRSAGVRARTSCTSPRRASRARADGAGHRRSLHHAAHREHHEPLARSRPRRHGPGLGHPGGRRPPAPRRHAGVLRPIADRLAGFGQRERERSSATTTAVVVQEKEDGVEDGHEVVFQTEAPKHQYRCFLESLKSGLPEVPTPGSETAPCK